MDVEATVRADRPSVIDETFDGEAVVVHLGTGRYYALNEAATEVWELVRDGRSPAELAELLGRSRGDAGVDFLGALMDEGLLVPGNGASPGPAPVVSDSRWADPPALQRFEDLQDLLLVDPIHEVTLGTDGWPVPAEK